MPDVWDQLDFSDPCALLDQLRPAYYRLLAGAQEVELRTSDRSVRLMAMATNLTQLEKLIPQLEAQCAAKEGRARRRAIVAG